MKFKKAYGFDLFYGVYYFDDSLYEAGVGFGGVHGFQLAPGAPFTREG